MSDGPRRWLLDWNRSGELSTSSWVLCECSVKTCLLPTENRLENLQPTSKTKALMVKRMQERQARQAEVGRVGLVIMITLWIPKFFPPKETKHKAGHEKHPSYDR